jgi:hypothetical protein
MPKQIESCSHCGKKAGWWQVKKESVVIYDPNGNVLITRYGKLTNKKRCNHCGNPLTKEIKK